MQLLTAIKHSTPQLQYTMIQSGPYLQAVAPGLHGAMIAKLAVLLALLGGVEASSSQGGGTTRANIHVLLAGDPATGAVPKITLS